MRALAPILFPMGTVAAIYVFTRMRQERDRLRRIRHRQQDRQLAARADYENNRIDADEYEARVAAILADSERAERR